MQIRFSILQFHQAHRFLHIAILRAELYITANALRLYAYRSTERQTTYCNSPIGSLSSSSRYRDAETALFEEALDAKAKAQAKIIVDQYFSKPRSKEEWDQIAAINDKVFLCDWDIYSYYHRMRQLFLTTGHEEQTGQTNLQSTA